jgi:hypothetical protein
MSKLLMLVGSTVGSYAGWWLGAHAGFMTAFILITVVMGAGIYGGRRIAQNYE